MNAIDPAGLELPATQPIDMTELIEEMLRQARARESGGPAAAP